MISIRKGSIWKGWGPTSPGRQAWLGLAMAMETMISLNLGSQLLGLQIGWKNHRQQGPPNVCRGIITSHVSWIFVSTNEGFDDLCVSLGTLKVDQSAVITFASDVVGSPNPRQVTAWRVWLHSVWFYYFFGKTFKLTAGRWEKALPKHLTMRLVTTNETLMPLHCAWPSLILEIYSWS